MSDLKDPEFVEKMHSVFDDEYFLLLKRNSPQYIGVPYSFGKEFIEIFNYNIREISATQLVRREALLSEEADWKKSIAYVLISSGSPVYCFLPHEPYLADRIHSRMKEILHVDFLKRNKIDLVTNHGHENQ